MAPPPHTHAPPPRSAGAKETTEDIVNVLNPDREQKYEEIRTVALVTTSVLAAWAGFSLIAAIVGCACPCIRVRWLQKTQS